MRFYFNLGDVHGVIPDEEGIDFPNLDAARAEARTSIQDLLADDIRRGSTTSRRHIEIADEHGATLDHVALAVTVS